MADSHLSHFDDQGRARMVDVGGKTPTERRARARGHIRISPDTFRTIQSGSLPKGDPFEIARIAGIAAAKKTAELIPLCHPLRLSFIDVITTSDVKRSVIQVEATVSAEEKTGVEMEALAACATALLTIYDMLKAVDRSMVIGDVRIVEKRGGQSDHADPLDDPSSEHS